jgi:hypothetical protein
MPADLEPGAARRGGRDFAALADHCRSLAGQLGGATRGIDSGPRAWTGIAARSGSARAGRLTAALGQAAGAAEDVAAILSVFAAVVQDAAAARGSAERLAGSIGCRLAPDGSAEGAPAGDTRHALLRARAESLAGQASEQVKLAARIAAAGFAEVAARAGPTCALVDRRSGFSSALERRLHGPVSVWDDIRQGVAKGLLGMVTGTAQAVALSSPEYWLLRPREARRLANQTVDGGLFALRHPGEAARLSLGLDDLENGHAWRFWAQFAPQVAAAAVTKGVASLAREAAAVERASAAVEQASARAELPIRHSLADINPGYPIFGRIRNCASCALATDATLAGRPASALPGGSVSIGVLEDHFGRQFESMSSRATIEATMRRLGPDARGIVFGSRGAHRPGHVFNVVNQDGTVLFIDGQRAAPATFDGEGYTGFYLLRTD